MCVYHATCYNNNLHMQVQRRQTYRPPHSYQDRPSARPTPILTSTSTISHRPVSGQGKTPEKRAKEEQEVDRVLSTSTCITDDEKVQVERAKRTLESTAETSVAAETEPVVTQEPERDSAVEGELDTDPSTVEDAIMQRLEVVQKEKIETQQKIASLTQTMSVLMDKSTEIVSPNVIVPLSQASTPGDTGGGGITQTVGDTIAQAAIRSGLEVDEEDSVDYQEPVQPSDAGISSDMVGEAEVHVVGEILSGESGVAPALIGQQPELNLSVQDTGQSDRDDIQQSYRDDELNSATEDQQVPKPTVTDQPLLNTIPESSASAANKQSPPTATNMPSSAVKTSRPKRQLAASFSKSTS